MLGNEPPREKYVEFLENGDILFSGQLLSAHEYAAGTALCGLKSGGEDSADSSTVEAEKEDRPVQNDVDTMVSELSDDEKPLDKIGVIIAAPKRRKRRLSKPPSVPEDDIRLTYSKRYFDAINMGDAREVKEVLGELAVPNCVLVGTLAKNGPVSASAFYFPSHYEVVGVDAIACFIDSVAHAVPDAEYRIQHERINCYINEESSIELTVSVRGTKLFKLDGFPEGEGRVVLSSGAVEKGLSEEMARLQVNTNVVAKVEGESENQKFGLGAMEQMREFSLTTHVTFHLNAQKRIFLIMSAK